MDISEKYNYLTRSFSTNYIQEKELIAGYFFTVDGNIFVTSDGEYFQAKDGE